MGAKKQPFYRVVVADSRSPRDGRFLDTIGTYNPRTEPAAIDIDREKTMKWLEEGALPTDSARALLSRAGIWQEFKTGAPAEAAVPAETRLAEAAESAETRVAERIEEPIVPAEGEAEARGEEAGEDTAAE
jgi:small subunit ribosomal protein S16